MSSRTNQFALRLDDPMRERIEAVRREVPFLNTTTAAIHYLIDAGLRAIETEPVEEHGTE